MDSKIEKRNNFIHFVEKWFIIGIILFIVIQLTAIGVVNLFIPKDQRVTEEQYEEYNEGYLGHWYDGTFFINMRVEENFESQEKYDEMIKEEESDSDVLYRVGQVTFTAFIFLLGFAAFRERKKKLLYGNTPIIIVISGLLLLIYKIAEQIDLSIEVSYWRDYSSGFLKTVEYYPMVHVIITLPVLLMLMGLLFRQKQRKELHLSTYGNEKIIKGICFVSLIIGLSFIVYRFGIRVFELLSMNSSINIRLPFYFYIFDLPRNYASTNLAYSKLITLRFIKDLPVFIASTVSIIMLYRIVLSSIKENFISEKNKKRFRIIFVSLIVSSAILNILGFFEVKLLNNEFLYQYKNAVYTLAVRSLSEPLLYGFFIYLFKHYIEIAYLTKQNKD